MKTAALVSLFTTSSRDEEENVCYFFIYLLIYFTFAAEGLAGPYPFG